MTFVLGRRHRLALWLYRRWMAFLEAAKGWRQDP
jgi:hypothetical protein